MSILDFFRRLAARRQRDTEMSFRLKSAELKRRAAMIGREADRSKAEAVRLEKSGDHAGALAKSCAALNQEKSYRMALTTISNCENLHAQAKAQNALKQLMLACRDISLEVTGEADMEGAVRAQSQMQEAVLRMDESQEAMSAFQQGFDLDADPGQRSEAAEMALAQILREQAGRERAEAAAPIVPAPAAPAEEPARREWIDARRRLISEMTN